MTSSAPADPPPGRAPPPLRDRVFAAFDILAGDARRIGVAVSGGSDSTALLVFAATWAAARGVTARAATVDHGLRPEATGEARRAAALCADLGLAHQTLLWRPDPPVSQAAARRARHGLLARWARASALPVVCFGHTRDDRIETFLIRARAGSHWRGLAGPMPSAPAPVWPDGDGVRLVRPLLAFQRQDLRDDLAGRGISWSEDPSNDATRYERVRMRRLAARLDAATRARTIAIMDRLADLRSAVAGSARETLEASARATPGEAMLEAAAFRRLGAETRLRLIEALVMAAGGSDRPPRTDRLDRLALRLSQPGGIGAGATLTGAWVTEAGPAIRFRPAPARRRAVGDGGPERPSGFSLARAEGLLGDPRTAAFRV